MSEYRLKSTGEVLSQGAIRKLNPNVSLPRVWGANVLETLGIDPVFQTPKPEASDEWNTVVRNGVTQDEKGNWVWAWKEQAMFTEYTDEEGNTVTVEQQKTQYTERKNSEAANNVRTRRDNLLKETDWMTVRASDAGETLSGEWATYRQALRDITDHANFPNLEEADWPTKPE